MTETQELTARVFTLMNRLGLPLPEGDPSVDANANLFILQTLREQTNLTYECEIKRKGVKCYVDLFLITPEGVCSEGAGEDEDILIAHLKALGRLFSRWIIATEQ